MATTLPLYGGNPTLAFGTHPQHSRLPACARPDISDPGYDQTRVGKARKGLELTLGQAEDRWVPASEDDDSLRGEALGCPLTASPVAPTGVQSARLAVRGAPDGRRSFVHLPRSEALEMSRRAAGSVG